MRQAFRSIGACWSADRMTACEEASAGRERLLVGGIFAYEQIDGADADESGRQAGKILSAGRDGLTGTLIGAWRLPQNDVHPNRFFGAFQTMLPIGNGGVVGEAFVQGSNHQAGLPSPAQPSSRLTQLSLSSAILRPPAAMRNGTQDVPAPREEKLARGQARARLALS